MTVRTTSRLKFYKQDSTCLYCKMAVNAPFKGSTLEESKARVRKVQSFWQELAAGRSTTDISATSGINIYELGGAMSAYSNLFAKVHLLIAAVYPKNTLNYLVDRFHHRATTRHRLHHHCQGDDRCVGQEGLVGNCDGNEGPTLRRAGLRSAQLRHASMHISIHQLI